MNESVTDRTAPPSVLNQEAAPRLALIAPISNASAIIDLLARLEDSAPPALDNLSTLPLKTLNMAILSSQAEIALLVIDAALGLEKRDYWTKTLACLAHIPHIVLAIDNMAQQEWSSERFKELKDLFADHGADFKCGTLYTIPVDLNSNQNIRQSSSLNSWYDGPPLLALISSLNETGKTEDPVTPEASSDQFAVHICWSSNQPMLPGRHYLLKGKGGQAEAHMSDLKYRLNPETLEHQAAKKLFPGDIGYGNISLDNAIDFIPFINDRERGRFTLHDKSNGELLAVGLIKHELRRATNIKWQALEVDKAARAASKKQSPCVLWFTGLSGSGKSTVASLVDKKLHNLGKHTYVLDGDNVRHGLCRDLGFTDADRVENLRRISETTKLLVDAGLIVLVSFISPFRSERRAARELFDEKEFVEIFVNTPLNVCESRDPKGLYKKARAGTLKNFTGIDSPYEPPEKPDIDLPGGDHSPEELADMLISDMIERGLITL